MAENEQNMQVTMKLIINAGNAKSFAMEAIKAAKEQDFLTADKRLKDAQNALNEAHNVQTGMLTEEAQGNKTELTLLMVHSQDHLMTAITFIDLAKELVDVYRRLK